MTVLVMAGGLLGAACAPPAARLAELMAHRQSGSPVRLRLLLGAALTIFGAAAAARHGVLALVLALLALVPAAAAAAVDVFERRLPDRLTAAVAVVVAFEVTVLLVVDPAAGARGAWAFVLGGTTAVAMKAVVTDAVGWGDVKLAPSLAALLAFQGWPTLYAGLLGWCLLIALTATLALVHTSPTKLVAYGPALVAATGGALVVIG